MNWVLLVSAVVAAGVAIFCLWLRHSKSKERALMEATPPSRAADVAKLAPGTVAVVKGMLRCSAPVTGEFSTRACAYFKAEIQRESEYYTTNSKGERERQTRTETIHTNVRFGPCTVADDSGSAVLALDGATIEGEQAFNQREREATGGSGIIGALLSAGSNATLIKTELLLPADIPVYVLGEVQPNGAIGKPAPHSKSNIFVVSNKSEEERKKRINAHILWSTIIGTLAGIAAVALFAFAMKG